MTTMPDYPKWRRRACPHCTPVKRWYMVNIKWWEIGNTRVAFAQRLSRGNFYTGQSYGALSVELGVSL
jgi:hypothetical protein